MYLRPLQKLCCFLLVFSCMVELHSYAPQYLEGKYQCGKICDSIAPPDWNVGVDKSWLIIMSFGEFYGSIEAVRRTYIPGTMVDNQGYFYAACLVGFNNYGPILYVYKYNTSGDLWGTWEHSASYWGHFYPGEVDKSPFVNDDNGIERKRFKTYINNALQPVIAQCFGFDDRYIWVGVYIPPHKYRSASSEDKYYGGFILEQIPEWFSTSLFYVCYVDDNSFDSTNYYSFPSLTFARTAKLRGGDDYVIPNGQNSFKIFRYEYNGTRYGNLYQRGQTSNDNAFNIYTIRGDAHFYTGTEGTGTGQSVNANGSIAFSNVNVKMTPRIFKIGSYFYSTFQTNGGYFNLCKQSLSEINLIRKTSVSNSHCMEIYNSLIFKYTPYDYDFCFLEEDGTPCTDSTPDNTRKIWCILCFGSAYGLLTEELGWSVTMCNYDPTNIACVLRNYYLPAEESNSWTPTGDWVQNSIYFTEAKMLTANAEEGKPGTTVFAGNVSDLYQIHRNTHRMVTYHSSSGKNYFIFAYCYPGKKKQLYLAYAQYIVDSDHKVRLTTKTYLSSGSWGDSFGNLTSCSRIISMDLSNGHLWICFMNEDDTEVRYFHVLAKDLILE